MTNNAPKVSVVIPVYNIEKYLRRCLNSITAQTYHNLEIIIVNDCSPDNSESIIQEYCKQDSRIHYLKNDVNLGLGASRDRGIHSAKGIYIMFVDSDDFIHHTTIEHCVEWIEKYDSDIVEFNFRYYREGDVIDLNRHTSEYKIEHIEALNRDTDLLHLNNKINDVCWNKLYKTDIIKKLGLEFRVRFYEDTPFTRAYSLNIKQAVIVSLPLYYYFINPSSITCTISTHKVIAAVDASCKVLDVFNKYNATFQIRKDYLNSTQKILIRFLLALPTDKRIEMCAYIENKNNLLKDKMHTINLFVTNNHKWLFACLCFFILGPKFWLKKVYLINHVYQILRRRVMNENM